MIFGAVHCFAIEAELLELAGKWSYGKLRFWVGGEPVGDFDDTSDLATSARWGRVFLKASAQRTRAELDDLPAVDVYELLYGRFVSPVDAASSSYRAGHWNRDPHVLDEVGESALRDKAAIVAVRMGGGTDRVLVSAFNDGSLSEAVVPEGQCDSAIEAYCAWVEGLRAAQERLPG